MSMILWEYWTKKAFVLFQTHIHKHTQNTLTTSDIYIVKSDDFFFVPKYAELNVELYLLYMLNF